MKPLRMQIVPVLVVLGLAGCGGQDPGQPPVNSISVGPKSDVPLAKAKPGIPTSTPTKTP